MLRRKTALGVLWNFLEQLGRRGITIAVTLLLARFLVPEDFGLMAMMTVFIAIATSVMNSGLKQALIRKQHAGQADFDTAFYANLGLGLIAYALLFAAAPAIAAFYQEPRLVALIRVVGLVVVINAFQVVQSAVLSRQLNFKAQLKASIPAAIVSGFCAVVLAHRGFGVWALVAQMIISATLVTILLWSLKLWRPSMRFDRTSFREMYVFGYKLFLAGLLETAFKNVYVVVIAKVFTAPIAGLYFFADRIRELLISQLVGAIQTVTYPALASIQDHDARLKAGYRKVLKITTFLLFPVVLLLAALADALFLLVFPPRWLPSVPYLQLMCVAAVLYPLHSINLNILKVKGRSDLFLGLEVYKKALLGLILLISYRHGVEAILIGQIVHSLLSYVPNSYFSSRLIDYSIAEQVADFLPALMAAGLVGAFIHWMGTWLTMEPLAELLLLGGGGLALYVVAAGVLRLEAYRLARDMLFRHVGGLKAGKDNA